MKNKYKKDDGRTIYDMSNVGNHKIKIDKKDNLNVSKKETRAMIKAAFEVYLPRFLTFIIGFGIAFLIIYFWLK